MLIVGVTLVVEGALNMATTGGFVLASIYGCNSGSSWVEEANAVGRMVTSPSFGP